MSKNVGQSLRCLQRLIHQKVEVLKVESKDDLSLVQAHTLRYLDEHKEEDVFQRDIEKILNVRRSTCTEILNVLERDGYIERHSVNSDKRLKKLVLTAKTKELHLTISKNVERLEALLKKDINEEELEIFFKVIDKMKQNVKEDLYD
ncbi:MAG: MarR family transcriptional regulator [Erysipelotrichaceae bacterium]|nr:MarR family transcriptional regulator [Erysipelotrichaceae bacterium]